MPSPPDAVEALRAALAVSPDNLPLRRHLAETLASLSRFEEAVEELRILLEFEPGSQQIKVQLADAYFQDSRESEAAAILESLLESRGVSAEACLLYARVCLRENRVSDAVAHYKHALEIDPRVEDSELNERLGFAPAGEEVGEESEVFEGRVRHAGAGQGARHADTEIERPRIGFDDVGGMEEIKEEIRVKILYPLEHPEIYSAYGKTIGGGIMTYGPPGCGKTYLARATAGEIGAGFISIGVSDVLDMWMGSSEQKLHQVFQQARENTPCVLFFDEVDALGGRRSDMQSGSARQLINQFLSELDGVEHSNEGVLVLAATNAPWHVDPAFRRPGRFDRVLFVPPPDEPARAEILRLHCAGKPVRDLDHNYLAKKTPRYSGADLKALVDIAVEQKLTEAIRTGKPEPITGKELQKAAKRHKPTTEEWFSSARNYALYSNQGGLYDDVLKFLDK
ncbi:MAG: AAA family ATPase [Planctomycetota bacterium]